jgi:phenylalanyl-tRNA synthetase alpha chain
MTSPDDLQALVSDAVSRIESAGSVRDLDAIEFESLGDDSAVAIAKRSLREADEETRRSLGRAVNEATTTLRAALDARRAALEIRERDARLAVERIDMTLPARPTEPGAIHLVRQVWDELVDVFVGLGYTVASGPEVDSDYHNFKALNYPDAHPARLETDTLYIRHGDDPEGVLLRTQTSTMQVRWMEEHDPPVYIVSPGRVYRRETTDATHTPVFHQLEGLAVDENITFGDLKGTLEHLTNSVFGKRGTRFLPNFFPFTEPSAEVQVSCFSCDGSGCRVCSQTGWIEAGGCGMVDPNVLENVGYDPSKVSGFAFGMGLDRIAMIRYGVPELRHFFSSDMRVLEQYR